MSPLQIETADGRIAFSPGEMLSGSASWQLEGPPQKAMLQLIWNTQGKGTADTEVVHTVPFAQPQPADKRRFTFQLPDSPYTFSGQLISLFWHLELTIEPDGPSASLEITIAPGGREVLLPRIQLAHP